MIEKKNNFFALLILAIIVIAIIACICLKFNKEEKKISELQIQLNNLDETVNNLQNEINSISEMLNPINSNEDTTLSDDDVEYQITGIYYEENARGDEPYYTFSENNKVTYGSLSEYSGIYSINNNTIKIVFTSAIDPDGNKIDAESWDVDESIELTIINDNQIRDNTNGYVYSK